MKNIVIFLDGTGNTLGDYNRKGHATHIRNGFDLISQSQRGKTPYNSKTVSGVGILTATVKNNSTLKDCYAIYIEGINSSIDALNGTGVLKRVQLAYQEISKVYNSGDAVHIYGFSRGAASALCLAHYINDFGVISYGSGQFLRIPSWLNTKTGLQDLFYDICLEKYPQLFAEGHKPYKGPVANVTLLDTVFSTTECDPKKHKWLTNVTGVARSITHFLAKHECRGSFSPSMLKTHERIYATKSIKANNFPGLNTLLNTPLYVLAPKEYDCLSQLHLDGSHSDIAGRHSNSILGLPVLDHMLHEFDIAGVPFKKELAIAIRNKMTVSKLKLETGLLRWRVLSSIGQTTELFSPYSQLAKARNKHRQIAYRPHVSPNPMVLCDPTCGDLLFENARFFYASYADVKRVLHDILMRPHPTDATMDIIDLSTIVEAVAYVDNLENEVSTDGCLFYHRDAQIEFNSFSLLDPSKNPCIPRNEQDIETNKQQNSDFETLVEKYYNEITAYNCVSHNKLSRSHLYKGSFDLNGITSNKFVWNNVKVLSRIHSEFMRTDTKTALLLEQMICKHFKISAIELNSLEDSFISVHPCP